MNITLIVLLAYLALMFLVAWYFSRKESIEAYFLNKRKTNLWMMTFSTVATVVGAGATVSVVSEVYNTGISYGIAFCSSFLVGMIVLGVMAKKIKETGDRYGAHTIVDFLGQRFDRKTKILTGLLQLFLMIIWTGVQAVAIASLASVLTGLDYRIALFLTATVTILYTAIGGLKIDIITDFIQFWVILLVFLSLAFLGYFHVGGAGNLISRLPEGHTDIFSFGGVPLFLSLIFLGGFVFLGNTVHWQRIFSAENENTARRSFFVGIPFVLLLTLLLLFLGLVASVSLSGITKERAIFSLMEGLLPSALVGVGFAAILAVVMSSIDSFLIGGATIIHRALFNKEEIEGNKEIFYARSITILFGICGFFFAFVIPNIVTLTLLVAYLAFAFVPPVFAAIYSRNTSANAGFYSILMPAIVLFSAYPVVGRNIFVLTGPLGILIVLLYDKIFKRREASLIRMQGRT